MDCSLYWWADCNVERKKDVRKKNKHQDLTVEIRIKGWIALVLPVEVGRRVFPAPSNRRIMTTLGIKSNTRRTGMQKLLTFIWIWSKSLQKNWKSSTDWRFADTSWNDWRRVTSVDPRVISLSKLFSYIFTQTCCETTYEFLTRFELNF